jgi:hypothetical protein
MKIVRIAPLVLALVAGSALAQSDPADPKKDVGASEGASMAHNVDWDRLDQNKDGFLSKNEVMGDPAVAQNFEKIDTDGDGKISREEWKARGRHKDHE